MRGVWTCVWVALALWCARGGAALSGAEVRGALAAPALYSLQSTVLLNAAERADREVGYRLEAQLAVTPRSDAGEDLLCFTLVDARVLVHRAADWERRASPWDGAPRAWCAAGAPGRLRALLLHPAEPAAVRDYQRALASLFQFQGALDGGAGGEHNETDALGECSVVYERLGGAAARKVRRACAADGAAGAAARRVTRVSLAAGALRELYAEEVVTLHAALKARSWHALARLDAPPPPLPSLELLAPHDLALEAAALPYDDDDDLDLASALQAGRGALRGEEAGAGGAADEARALLRLLPALRRAPAAALRAALEGAERAALQPLCRALGLAGAPAALQAAADFTRLTADDALEPLARAFLAGFSLALDARPAAVLDLVRLAGEARRPALAHAALQAAAAAARAPHHAARAAVREAATRALARCRDASCRAARLLALGNLRSAAAADALLEGAERGEGAVAAAALWALRGAGLRAPQLARLARLAVNASVALESRAAALELVVRAGAAGSERAAPRPLVELARALHAERSAAAHELRRVLWQRLDALRDAPPVRALLPLLPRELRTWDARAHAGTSHVVVRDTGWGGASAWRATLDSVQVAAGGLLRHGAVALHVRGRGASAGAGDAPQLEVEVWTRGLEALAGAPAEEPAPEPAAGLALSVGGARLHDVTLFEGQAALLAHVWAGSGSTPTPVLRALRPLHEARAVLPLLGGVALRVRARAAAALALDAHAAVSLWHRTARGALSLRAALHADVEARAAVPWARLAARRELVAQPRLRISLALDFYDGVQVCVRAAVPPHAVRDALRLEAVAGARRLNVTRGHAARTALPPRTLALGRDNDAACRTLHAADDEDDS